MLRVRLSLSAVAWASLLLMQQPDIGLGTVTGLKSLNG